MKEGYSSIFDYLKTDDIDVNASIEYEAPNSMMFTPDEVGLNTATLESFYEPTESPEPVSEPVSEPTANSDNMTKEAFNLFNNSFLNDGNLDNYETPEIWTIKNGSILRNKKYKEQ